MNRQKYYSIPFRADRITNAQTLETVDLETSIRQNLRLLLLSPPMKVQQHPDYGCLVHWHQFLSVSRNLKEEKMEDGFKMKLEDNIKQLIQLFEPRIRVEEVSLKIEYKTEHHQWKLKHVHATKNSVIQISVEITAQINEAFLMHAQSIKLEDTIPLL